MQKVRGQGQRSKQISSQFGYFWTVNSLFEFTDGYEMMYKAWSGIEEEEVLYCFFKSSIKFPGHTGHKLPILTRIECFQTVNSSLNSLMVLKWCTKLEVA